ncbi:MAG: hypothetical protein AB7J32_11235, partial [Pseudonocardia sp.]
GSGKEVFAVATAQLDGRPVIVSGGLGDDVHLWDLATHAAVGAPLDTGGRTVFALVVTQLAGRPLVVAGLDDGTMQVWDLRDRTTVATLRGSSGRVGAVTVMQRNGRPVVIASGSDDIVRAWDLTTGATIGHPFRNDSTEVNGITGDVEAMTVADVDGRALLVTGSYDRLLRVWDLAPSLGI